MSAARVRVMLADETVSARWSFRAIYRDLRASGWSRGEARSACERVWLRPVVSAVDVHRIRRGAFVMCAGDHRPADHWCTPTVCKFIGGAE